MLFGSSCDVSIQKTILYSFEFVCIVILWKVDVCSRGALWESAVGDKPVMCVVHVVELCKLNTNVAFMRTRRLDKINLHIDTSFI